MDEVDDIDVNDGTSFIGPGMLTGSSGRTEPDSSLGSLGESVAT